jgi:serine phosphatase RsbU (regulator of sigma subunit)
MRMGLKKQVIFVFMLLCSLAPLFGQSDSITVYKLRLGQPMAFHDKFGICYRLTFLEYKKGDFQKAIQWGTSALEIARQKDDSLQMGRVYRLLGTIYTGKEENEKARDCYSKAQQCFAGCPAQLIRLGLDQTTLHLQCNELAQAASMSKELVAKVNGQTDHLLRKSILLLRGEVLFQMARYDSAMLLFQQCLQMPLSDPDSLLPILNYLDIGNLHCRKLQWKKGMPFLSAALHQAEAGGWDRLLPKIYGSMADAQYKLKETKTALEYAELCLRNAFKIQDFRSVMDGYLVKTAIDSALGRADSAHLDLFHFVYLNDSVHNTEFSRRITEMQSKFDIQKKDKDIQSIKKDTAIAQERLDREKQLSRFMIAALPLFAILLLVIYRNVRAKKKANALLEIQKAELDEKRRLLEVKNEQISDSIRYAQRIQEALLPSPLFMDSEVMDHFVWCNPKDIVSGDFYWRHKRGENLFFAAIDCTGHGVPGAMMSMLAYDMLEYALNDKGLKEPSEIISSVNAEVIKKMQKSSPEHAKDGMDMSLCRFNLRTRELCYAGAKNDMILISDKGMEILTVDKASVGYERNMPFTQKSRILTKGDMLYLFSDGFADQKGGKDDRKFMMPRFRELLSMLASRSCEEQKQQLDGTYNTWKGNSRQRDDILIIGLRCI